MDAAGLGGRDRSEILCLFLFSFSYYSREYDIICGSSSCCFQLLAKGVVSGMKGSRAPKLALLTCAQGVTHSSGLHLTAYPMGVSRPPWRGGGSLIFPPLGKNVPTSSKVLRSGPSPSPET